MKRVVALITNYWTEYKDGKPFVTNRVAIHKGSIYHVTNEILVPGKILVRGIVRQGMIVYELLELIGTHDEALFKELPDDYIEDEVVEQIEKLITNKN